MSNELCKVISKGLTSRHKLKALVYLWHCLIGLSLVALATTCAHFGRDQICTQFEGSLSLFGHPTQVNASWVMSVNLLSANELQDMSALNCFFFFATCMYLHENLQVRLTTQCKFPRKINLWLLVWGAAWFPTGSHPQVNFIVFQ